MERAITIKDVYEKVSKLEEKIITKKELLEYMETFEILSDTSLLESIKKSREDIEEGRVKKVENVQQMLDELGDG